MAGFMDPERQVSLPTQEKDKRWICCSDESGKNSGRSLKDVGKWMIFSPIDKIDADWQSVCIATRKGDLGFASKVATAMDIGGFDPKSKVICVYTYDSDDQADVMRVRTALREIGFTRKLCYKTDAATCAGKYSHLGHSRISKYYS